MTSTRPEAGSGELIGGGRYRLGGVIGTGGMATVHRAHDLILDRDVAVKVFREDVAQASDTRRVEAEMKLLGSISHPGLVTLHDASLSDDGSTAFLVMELIDGDHLAKRLEQGPLPTAEAMQIVAQVASALAHIHRRGIVHRDVKPANILLRHEGDERISAKLADLGIARVADSTRLTTAGTILGTVAYLSPEQVSGGAVDAPADVYALGLVLLESITGQRAFPGTPAESAAMRTVSQPPIPDDLDPVIAELTTAMTRRNPRGRVSAGEVESTLRAILDGGSPTRAFSLFPPREAEPDTDTSPELSLASLFGVPEEPEHTERLQPQPQTATRPAAAIPPQQTSATVALPRDHDGTVTTSDWRAAPPRRSIPWPLLIGVAIAVLLLLAVLLVWLLPGAGPADGGSPGYPAVPGELGELLQDLQESVER